LRDWWTPEDEKNFNERAQCVKKQFESYKIQDDLHENGDLVLGESIADLGGLNIAYRALEKELGDNRPPSIGGFTTEQRFFLSYTQIWRRLTAPNSSGSCSIRIRTRSAVCAPLPRRRICRLFPGRLAARRGTRWCVGCHSLPNLVSRASCVELTRSLLSSTGILPDVLKYLGVAMSRRDAGATKPFAATRWFFSQIESLLRRASPTFGVMFLLDYT